MENVAKVAASGDSTQHVQCIPPKENRLLLTPTTHAHAQALEPSISKEIMTLHHTKHHQTYVNGLNAAEESLAKFQSSGDVKGALGLQAALKFNGGGHM
jgi:Fe-Mn family superoxide dismutase